MAATYTCDKCGMGVNMTCASCGAELVHGTITTAAGAEVAVSECPAGHAETATSAPAAVVIVS